jgi:hypothetical protein
MSKRLFPLLIATIATGAAVLAQGEADIDYVAARANPVLRAVFAERTPYSVDEHHPKQRDAESMMHEQWVDRQVDYFVRDVYQKMAALRAAVDKAQAARLESLGGGAGSDAVVARWKDALKATEEGAKSVRKTVSAVLMELDVHDKTRVKITNESRRKRFEDEMKDLSEELKLANQAVSDYFFKPTHVTSVTELREANMLDFLSRVEKIARAVRGEL